MKMPLTHDKENRKCNLLDVIFNIIDSRKTKQELSRNNMKPVNTTLNYVKVALISMFYKMDKFYIVNELNNSDKLRKDFGFQSKLNYFQIAEVFSRFDDTQVLEFVIKLSNKQFKNGKRGIRKIIIDSTDIQFNINLKKEYKTKEKLEEKGYEIGFSTKKGSFIGGKLTIAMDYNTCQPLTMLFHPGAVSDIKLYEKILKDLDRRRILKNKDIIYADKGYLSYNNYYLGLIKYKIVPMIYPKKNIKKEKIMSQFNYPLETFNGKNKLIELYKSLVTSFNKLFNDKKTFKYIRSKIEDFNKFFKNGVGYEKIPSYTYKSVKKTTYLSVLLATLISSYLKPDKKLLQQLSEM